MARPGRFERPTSGSGDQRSIQLSYGRAVNALRRIRKKRSVRENSYTIILTWTYRPRHYGFGMHGGRTFAPH